MKKKKHHKPLKQSKRRKQSQKKSRDRFISKPFLLSASIVLALVIFIYATYAWNTAADEKSNKFEGTRLSATITEVFVPNLQWVPGTQTEKVIRVENNGEAAAFVRVSLSEYLAAFQVSVRDNHDGADKDGNGNLQITKDKGDFEITFKNFTDWQDEINEDGKSTYQISNDPAKYYIGSNSWASKNFVYPDGSDDRNKTPLEYLSIQFTNRVKDKVTDAKDVPNGQKNNWFYHDGYFYFTSVLYPGEMTTPLTNGVTVSEELPNAYKGALYVMDVQMDAVDIIEGSLSDWDIKKGDPVYDVLEDHIVTYGE